MKGIIVEINTNTNHAAVLSDDGMISKINNKKYEIGQVIIMKKNKKLSSKIIAGAATFVAAAAICTIGGFAYYTPTDYVSLDVNPSIEYSVNTFDRIIDVKAVNDDGQEILTSLSLKNKTIQDALKETIDKLIADGFLTNDENGGVILTTSSEDMEEAKELASDLQDELQDYIDDQDEITAEVKAEAVGAARVEEAKALGVTPGKLNLVEKLQASTGGAISIEEWLAMPVKDINKAIKENRELAKMKDKEDMDDNDDLDDIDDIDDDQDLDDEDQDLNDQDNNKQEKEKEKITNENKNTNTNNGNKKTDPVIVEDDDQDEDQDEDQIPEQELEQEKEKNSNHNGGNSGKSGGGSSSNRNDD